ncbi:MAG: hypothetical protein AAFU54_25925 [Chloroflexota bacterium]
MLKYHQRTFDYLKREPVISEQRKDSVRAFGQYIGVDLPESFVKWFSLEGSEEQIRFNDDRVAMIGGFRLLPNPLFPDDKRFRNARFVTHSPLWPRVVPDTFTYEGFLVFIFENQGVCFWGIDLNRAEDPPVYVRWNDPDARWIPCSDSFSEFVFARVWDTANWFGGAQAQANKVSFTDLAYLEQNYTLVQTGGFFAGYRQVYRFEREDKRIWVGQSRLSDHSDWHINAETEDSIIECLRDIWHLNNLSESTYTYGTNPSLQQKLNAPPTESGWNHLRLKVA